MSAAKPYTKLKNWGFGASTLKNFPELIPLLGLLSIPCLGSIAFMGYSLYQKTDVRVFKKTELPPWERVNPEERQKLYTLKQEYKKIPELEQLKQEIGSYKC